ncbi:MULTISPECIES: hypothetical protein [Photorhabdus]|uniref:SecY/secA suppressor protein n=1 Tax=Photorhabdus kayaii TaxID=230088 RepID=A0ABX0B3I9_9GAMM|nr:MULTISPECIES: hypothetical protein [Photorhabdus]MCC8376421.1 hypothetical protein [Photorhabdus bodei]MCT8353866.1 hypothetical protein [Photorhabdus kayaii]NDL14494.1 hypothetical protein [Photorhabdus kayaii]NDL25978.1 hypothetical protein [Photorhabdus kayaii]RAX09409.1 hypothetical protein CKY10_12045 [Photorhabdus sp. HUG-39]
MTIAELIELLKEHFEDWESRELEIPDEFNGGWLTVEPENVVIESDNRFIRLDCWMSYPDELED